MDGGAQPHLGYTTDFLARSTAAYTCFFGMPKLLATSAKAALRPPGKLLAIRQNSSASDASVTSSRVSRDDPAGPTTTVNSPRGTPRRVRTSDGVPRMNC